MDFIKPLMDNFWMIYAIVTIIAIVIGLIILIEYYNRKAEIQEQRSLEDEKRARLEDGKRRLEGEEKVQFEMEQRTKGLVKFVEEKWGTPEEVEIWQQELFEKQQIAKGLVNFDGEWVTPEEKFEREQTAKGLVKFVDRHGKERWGTPDQAQEWKRAETGLQSNFSDLSPKQFEEFIADLFKTMGYNVQLLSYRADSGGGVLAQKNSDKTLILCKKFREGHNVGDLDVLRTLALMLKNKANKSVLVTTSDFTVQAHEEAEDTPIELWNKEMLHEVVEKYYLSEDLGVEAREELNGAVVNLTKCPKCGAITPLDRLESSASGLPQCPSCGSEIPLTEKEKSTPLSKKRIPQEFPTGGT